MQRFQNTLPNHLLAHLLCVGKAAFMFVVVIYFFYKFQFVYLINLKTLMWVLDSQLNVGHGHNPFNEHIHSPHGMMRFICSKNSFFFVLACDNLSLSADRLSCLFIHLFYRIPQFIVLRGVALINSFAVFYSVFLE